MPLQNRVLPTGEIIADPARGTFLGNRGGRIHDEAKRLTKSRWASKAWITCRLAFKGRKRELMGKGQYTELFFLDEAVAMAAGHRPCAECRREDFNRFKAAFAQAHGPVKTVKEIDAILHGARVRPYARTQITHEAEASALPDGTFIELGSAPWLLRGDTALRFTPNGYADRRARPTGLVTVLTPAPLVATLAAGYSPTLHESAL